MPVYPRAPVTSPVAFAGLHSPGWVMSWKSKLAQIVVGVLTLIALLIGSAARGARGQSSQSCTPCLAPDVPPPPSVVKMRHGNHLCSGTVVAVSGGEALVLCCNHCFARQNPVTGQFGKGNYPAKCQIERLSDGKVFDGEAVDGSPEVDSAVIVVRGVAGAVAAPVGRANVGDSCEHWGISSEHARGRITRYDDGGRYPPDQSERSTLRSIPGDSGAGVFVGGKLAAVNWGYWNNGEQGGTAVVHHLRFARQSRALSGSHADLWRGIPGDPAVPGLPQPPIVPVYPGVTPPACPPGGCPLPYPVHRRPLLPWRR